MKKFNRFLFVFSLFLSFNLYSTTWVVNARDFVFDPANLPSVNVGDSIKWQWLGPTAHTTTSTSVPPGAAAWDNPLNNTVSTFIYRVTTPGSYQYKCTPHPNMIGSFTVNPIGIKSIGENVPKNFKLEQNYPNPFNPVTNIKFDIPYQSYVKLTIYNLIGGQVEVLVNHQLSAGSYVVDWNASNYSSGFYFYKIEAGDFVETKKMALIK